MKKINEDTYNIGKNILRLFKNSIPKNSINLNIAGGALRDFLANKESEIKDIDLIMSFNHLNKYNTQIYDPKIEKIRNLSMEEKINIYSDFTKKIYDFFIKEGYEVDYFNRIPKDQFVFDDILNPSGGYDTLESLFNIVKIKGKDLNYNIDILLVDDVNNYVQKYFDFNLCKVEAPIIEKGILPENSINLVENGLEKFKDKNALFYDDLENKKITYDVFNKTEKDIINSFEKHLKRIKNKYPDFNIKLGFEDIKNSNMCILMNQPKLINFMELSKSLLYMFEINKELNFEEEKNKVIVKKFKI